MSKWESLAIAVSVLAFMGGIAGTGMISSYKNADVKISCNNLKAAAIAASQPEPKCG